MNTLSISDLGFSGSGCGSGVSSSSTNLLRNCSFNRLRISFCCFSYSALISACISSFSLPSFLKLPNFVNPADQPPRFRGLFEIRSKRLHRNLTASLAITPKAPTSCARWLAAYASHGFKAGFVRLWNSNI